MKYSSIDFNDKTILISGGAGFIGSNLIRYFQENYPKSNLVVFDCFRSSERFPNGNLKSLGHFENIKNYKGDLICGNINNFDDLALLNKYKFDYLFHQAAISDTRVDDQEIIIRTNVNSFYHFLEIARTNNASLIYASSASTYGNLPSPQKIGSENPENPYGFSKLMMDQVAIQYINKYPKMKIIGLRYFNVYGHNEFFKDKTSSMIIQLGLQMLAGKNPILFEKSNQYLRDFVYINDVIQANIKACNSRQNGVFNVGTGVSRSFQEVADILQKTLGTKLEVEYIKNPYDNYQASTQADISDTKLQLDYSPKYTLEDGIGEYIDEIKRIHNSRHND